MSHEIRQRIVRAATPEEKQRHQTIREQTADELPELTQWARQVAAKNREQVVVGTVFSAEEAAVLTAIDDYATTHALSNRAAVVREALSQLLQMPISR
jgi:plasmid replication initiation protein